MPSRRPRAGLGRYSGRVPKRPLQRADAERPGGERPAGRALCRRCWKPGTLCLCARLRAVANRTEIVIIQHPRERFHPLGTARIAALGLIGCTVQRPRDPVTQRLALAPCAPQRAGLLFPGIPGHFDAPTRSLADLAPEERPPALVVLDGTWPQARALYRENAWLRGLPHFRLEPREPSRYRIRRSPRRSYVSTLEAIVEALSILEPTTAGIAELLGVFDAMIDDQIAFAHQTPRRPQRKFARQARERAGMRTP